MSRVNTDISLLSLSTTQLRKIIKEQNVVIPTYLDKRYKNTLLFCLGLNVNPVSKPGYKTLDYISKWDWACRTKKDSESEKFIMSATDEELLRGFKHTLSNFSSKYIRRAFYLLIKSKDYLFEDLFDIVMEVNPSNFSLKDIKLICLEIMEEEGEKQLTAYELLEVSKSVTKFELKKVYRALCKIHHPDYSDCVDYDYFNMITHAYQEILSDIDRKTQKQNKQKTNQTTRKRRKAS